MLASAETGPGGFVVTPRDDLCLSFVNTRYWRGSDSPTEELHGIDDLLAWAATTASVDPELIRQCQARWDEDSTSSDAFQEAIALRETLHRVFTAVAERGEVPPSELASLNAALNAAPGRSRLEHAATGCAWGFRADAAVPALLAPVLWSAGDLLTGPRLARIRRCANVQCRWLFLDDSKSGNRRWCSMSACGNRAKAHRHYIKHRQHK
jgi:predicted RNA-binding Zn ribbon-like protein